MLEIIFKLLDGIDLATGMWGTIWHYLGLKLIAAMLLKRRRSVQASGLHFYQDRNTLDAFRSWASVMEEANTVDGLFVIGDKVLRSQEHLEKIGRFLVPNPDSASLKAYASQMQQMDTPTLIRGTTKNAQALNINVKWCPQFLGYSMLLIDKDEDKARVHIEYALPHIKSGDRPAVVIWRRRFPKPYIAFRQAFDDLWDASSKPTDAQLKPQVVSATEPNKAIVKFSTAGVPTIQQSANVSSLTDTGAGEYTVTFGSEFRDDNYSVIPMFGNVYSYAIKDKKTGAITFVFEGKEPEDVGFEFKDT